MQHRDAENGLHALRLGNVREHDLKVFGGNEGNGDAVHFQTLDRIHHEFFYRDGSLLKIDQRVMFEEDGGRGWFGVLGVGIVIRQDDVDPRRVDAIQVRKSVREFLRERVDKANALLARRGNEAGLLEARTDAHEWLVGESQVREKLNGALEVVFGHVERPSSFFTWDFVCLNPGLKQRGDHFIRFSLANVRVERNIGTTDEKYRGETQEETAHQSHQFELLIFKEGLNALARFVCNFGPVSYTHLTLPTRS